MSTIGIGVDEVTRNSSPVDANLRANKLTLGASVPFAPGWSGSNDVPTQAALYNQLTNTVGVNSGVGLAINAVTTLATPVDVGMEIPLLANSKYSIKLGLSIGCNNTGGIAIGIVTPNSTKRVMGIGNSTTSSTFVRWTSTNDSIVTATPLNLQNATTGGLHASGTITTVAADSVKIQFQSAVAGQTSTVFANGSYLEVTKIG